MNRILLTVLLSFFSLYSFAGNPVTWDLTRLFSTPNVTPMHSLDTCGINAVLIDGVDFKGEPTKFFAYYGIPEGADDLHKVPAMVLIHGGLGTAYWEWVKVWNERGYAAIAMDTNGKLPVQVPKGLYDPSTGNWMLLPGGIFLDWGGFERGLCKTEDQWPYCAVAEVILSHSLLRSLPGVDTEKIGLTGNSWGGFLTLLTAAVDNRFKFAAPVYASGFYDEIPGFADEGEGTDRWYTLFDPKHYIPQIEVPILWAAGTNDFAFAFGVHQKSMALAHTESYKAIRLRMVHTDGKFKEGQPAETFALADHMFKGAPGLPVAEAPVLGKKGTATLEYEMNGRELASIDLLYTTSDNEIWKEREWISVPVVLPKKGKKLSVAIPEGTTAFFFNVNTTDNLIGSSSAVIFK